MIPQPLQEVIEAVRGLGIGSAEALTSAAERYLRGERDMDQTQDDTSEVQGFLTHLLHSQVLKAEQYRVLVSLLGVNVGVGEAGASGFGSKLGHRFGEFFAQGRLGEGGHAKVYRAQRAGDPTTYVLKVCSVDDPDGQARFRREGEVLAAIRHPNVVGLVASGSQAGRPYHVLEFVDGSTLQSILEARRYLPWESATRAVRQIALGLSAAHAKGFVHRDVKPGNVLVGRDGNVKLCDFGVSTLDATITGEAGQILGSPAYIAPEQWGDHRVDARADLFALGVIYYQLVTGNLPFNGRTPADFSRRIMSGEYTSLRGLTQVPPSVAAVVDQLLETDRRYRTPSAAALVEDLDRLLRRSAANLPRLERTEPGPADEDAPDVHYLVGRKRYLVGSATACEVWLGPSASSMQQALLDRTPAGLLLRVIDDANPVLVNNQRLLREVVLKPGDTLQFGPQRTFRYSEGNLDESGGGRPASARRSGVMRAFELDDGLRIVPGLLASALCESGHPAALLLCIEALDERTARAERRHSAKRLAMLGMDQGEAEDVEREAHARWLQRVEQLANVLFRTTHENLGKDAQAWLSWWFEVGERFPLQIMPPTPRVQARLEVHETDRPQRHLDLVEGESWSVGRASETDIVLDDLSASRIHARLYRLVTRFAVRDLGSRQGVRHQGARTELALLQPGDVIELGRARLSLTELTSIGSASPRYPAVDYDTFSALVGRRSPLAAPALVDLLSARPEVEPELAGQLPEGGERLAGFAKAWRQRALDALIAMAGSDLGPSLSSWRRWLAKNNHLRSVMPSGWIAD